VLGAGVGHVRSDHADLFQVFEAFQLLQTGVGNSGFAQVTDGGLKELARVPRALHKNPPLHKNSTAKTGLHKNSLE